MLTLCKQNDSLLSGPDVRTQIPLALDDMSEPKPDVAVVPGSPRDYLDDHPTTAVLIVEVARVSLGIDQSLKKSLYARNGIQDYWIVNLDAGCVEVYRQPQGDSYQSEMRLYRGGDTVQPLAQPQYSTPVTELLP
jgi:Uma2 family endonuclease